MLKILHRYLLKKFFINLVFSVLAWVVIFIVINMVEQLSGFLDNGATTSQVMRYYFYFIPWIISLTLPVCVLLATLFAVSGLSQHNEIVAQLTAGISLIKILFPLFIVGLLITVASGMFDEYVVPVSNQKRLDIERYEIKKRPHNLGKLQNNIFLQDTENRKMAVKYFNGDKNEGRNVSIQTFDGARMIERVDAKRMYWQDSSWVLKDVLVRHFYGPENESIHALKDTIILDSRIHPDNLTEVQKKPEEMSYRELTLFIGELTSIGADARKWIVERQLKISVPFANFIVILIGAPFASRKRRGGTGLNFGLSLIISFTFFILIRVGQVMGYQGTLTPLLGAWLGNIVFFTLGIYTFLTAQR